MDRTQVVIIGGGATGAGILWDLSLRGIAAVLLEKRDLANGATGRCHGLLHSGARYAVKDAEAARECLRENRILKTIAPHCIHDVGGLFVRYPQDDPAFFVAWDRACADIGLPTAPLSAAEALDLEPNLPSGILGASTCPDAHVDVFQLTLSNLQAAVARGGRFRAYAEVTAIERRGGQVTGVRFRDTLSGDEDSIDCEMVVNAGGGWAQQVAALAGLHVPVRCDKGSLLVLNHNLVTRVVNRCRKPGDADILVPAGPVCILGTSSITVSGPEGLRAETDEIEALLKLGTELVPCMAESRVLRIFSGVRPLYVPQGADKAGGREISRGFALLDHGVEDNLDGFVSIVGGKLTTYRLMAEKTCDLVASRLGVDEPCRTAETPLRPPTPEAVTRKIRHLLPAQAASIVERRLGPAMAQLAERIEADPDMAEILCECEQVTRAEVAMVMAVDAKVPVRTINDVGRRCRLGFGSCQGTFCGYRAMLEGYRQGLWPAEAAAADFKRYLDERWKGQAQIPNGKQLEQLMLSHDLFGPSHHFHSDGEG